MANTKTHPGAFRCYEAALPDEPMFVILGRDPAGPATLEFWATERVRQEKVHEPDDQGRIKAAIDEAKDMMDWRERHRDPVGDGVPAWKLPRMLDEPGDRPVREIAMAPELGMPYGLPESDIAIDPTFRQKIAIGLRQVTADLKGFVDARVSNPQGHQAAETLLAFVDRINGYAGELEASKVDPYETFAASFRRQQAKPIKHLWSPGADEDEIEVTPLSFTRMSELLDYATCYGEFDETTPDGTISKYGESMSSPMNAERRAAIWVYKRCMGIIPEGAEPPVAAEPVPTVAVYVEGMFAVPGIDKPQTMEQIAAMYRKAAENITVDGVKLATVDSKPEDLAHAPEVPHHRFSVFHEAGDYAYARGLEVSPMHLATALDAMAKSGWHLCAIFGQTDAQHIGFIFRREVERFSAFEIAHGFGGGFDTATRRSTEDSPEFARFKAGEPLDDIRGKTFRIDGLDPETTHHTKANWSLDVPDLRRAMESLRPDKRTAFLLAEKAESIPHYWETASVASLLRFIHLIGWQDRVVLMDPISPEAISKALGCGGEGQEPCPEWGRGLAI